MHLNHIHSVHSPEAWYTEYTEQYVGYIQTAVYRYTDCSIQVYRLQYTGIQIVVYRYTDCGIQTGIQVYSFWRSFDWLCQLVAFNCLQIWLSLIHKAYYHAYTLQEHIAHA